MSHAPISARTPHGRSWRAGGVPAAALAVWVMAAAPAAAGYPLCPASTDLLPAAMYPAAITANADNGSAFCQGAKRTEFPSYVVQQSYPNGCLDLGIATQTTSSLRQSCGAAPDKPIVLWQVIGENVDLGPGTLPSTDSYLLSFVTVDGQTVDVDTGNQTMVIDRSYFYGSTTLDLPSSCDDEQGVCTRVLGSVFDQLAVKFDDANQAAELHYSSANSLSVDFGADAGAVNSALLVSHGRYTTYSFSNYSSPFYLTLDALAPTESLLAAVRGYADSDAMQYLGMTGMDLSGQSFAGWKLQNADFTGSDLSSADFTGADLRGAVFDRAKLAGAKFDGAMITGASFVAADLSGQDFSGKDLTGARFDHAVIGGFQMTGSILTGASFVGLDLTPYSFVKRPVTKVTFDGAKLAVNSLAGADITGASFNGVAFVGWDLSGYDFSGLSLQGATIRDSNLAGARFAGARLDRATLSGLQMNAVGPSGGLALCGASLSGVDLSRAALDMWDFTEATLQGVDATATTFTVASFQDMRADAASTFVGATFQRADPPQSGICGADAAVKPLDGALFAGSDLTGAAFLNTPVTGARFSDGTGPGGAAKLRKVYFDKASAQFTNTTFDFVDMSGVDLRGTAFAAAHFRQTNFAGAVLTGTDWSAATLAGVNLENADLTGATFGSASQSATIQNDGDVPTNLRCSQLGGADFSNASFRSAAAGVVAADLTNAIAFTAASIGTTEYCCPSTGTPVCGNVRGSGAPFGLMKPPRESGLPITFPNGESGVVDPDASAWVMQDPSRASCTVPWVSACAANDPPKCDGDVTPTDPALAACVRDALKIASGTPISAAMAASVTALSCPGRGIASMTMLNCYPNIATLDLSGNRIVDVSPVYALAAPVTLNLSGNRVVQFDMASFRSGAQTARLDSLDLSGNAPLQTLFLGTIDYESTPLSSLSASGGQLTEIDLSYGASLRSVDLSDNRLTATAELPDFLGSSLPDLETLDLQNNVLPCLGDISKAGNLRSLNYTQNPHFNCQSLNIADSSPLCAAAACANGGDTGKVCSGGATPVHCAATVTGGRRR